MAASRRLGAWVARKTQMHPVDRGAALSLTNNAGADFQVYGKERRGQGRSDEGETIERAQRRAHRSESASTRLCWVFVG